MPKSKDPSLTKKTLNLRSGDFDKMGQLFPAKGPSRAIRDLISKFVDNQFKPEETQK